MRHRRRVRDHEKTGSSAEAFAGDWFRSGDAGYLREGYLYLHDGCWNGTRVLPEDWVKRSTEPSVPFVSSAPEDEDTPNGWMWWLNVAAGPAKEKPWPAAPGDTYSAIGHWGQYVVVVPSADVVIVRTGDDRDEGITLKKLIPLALEVAK